MNILMLSYWDFQGAGMQVTTRTPVHFAERGHEVVFMVHREMTTNAADVDPVHPRLEVIRFDLPLRALARIPKVGRLRQLVLFGWSVIAAIRALARRGWRPDVVYAAECDAILIGSILRRLLGVPFVTRYYGVSTQLAAHPLRHGLYALSLRRPAHLAVMTDDGTGGEAILRRVNRRVGHVVTLRNGIDRSPSTATRVEVRTRLGVAHDEVLLLTVSRLYGWKRVDRAVRVIAALSPDESLRLAVVGGGPDRERLEALASDLGVKDRVVFVGPVPHAEVAGYFRAADVFLTLYDMSNLGNPLFEAMTQGCCVVALDTGETASVVEDDGNGRLVGPSGEEDETVERVAAAVRALVREPAVRARLGAAAREWSERNLQTWEERLDVELAAIERVVAERGRP